VLISTIYNTPHEDFEEKISNCLRWTIIFAGWQLAVYIEILNQAYLILFHGTMIQHLATNGIVIFIAWIPLALRAKIHKPKSF
jgi:hypothetical protein